MGQENKGRDWDLFDQTLISMAEDIEFEFAGHPNMPWSDFFLNPRRLRGSDFLMRWNQGVWSERIVIESVNDTSEFYAIPYGPSSVAPDDDHREHELYFERLEEAGLSQMKRPDILIFRNSDKIATARLVQDIGGERELPFTPEDNDLMRELLSKAVIAVECENSLWRVSQMPDYGSELRPMRRLDGRLGLPKNAVLPTVILKEEDRERLFTWQRQNRIPIHIWHVFYDRAFGLGLDAADSLIAEGLIEPTRQRFQAPGGATTEKYIYKFYYHYAYPIGEVELEPSLVAESITDRNGHILPYVRFEGGKMTISPETLRILREAAA